MAEVGEGVEDQFCGAGAELLLELSNTMAYFEEQDLGSGLLSINEQTLDWTSSNDDHNMKLSFPYIAVHAVSRETSVFPFKPCIFILYSVPEEDNPEQEVTKTYRFSTEDSEQRVVDVIFETISECQQLYPDSELSSDSGEEDINSVPLEGGYFTTVDGLQHLSLEGESVLTHLENIIQQSQSHQNGNGVAQFEDADAT